MPNVNWARISGMPALFRGLTRFAAAFHVAFAGPYRKYALSDHGQRHSTGSLDTKMCILKR